MSRAVERGHQQRVGDVPKAGFVGEDAQVLGQVEGEIAGDARAARAGPREVESAAREQPRVHRAQIELLGLAHQTRKLGRVVDRASQSGVRAAQIGQRAPARGFVGGIGERVDRPAKHVDGPAEFVAERNQQAGLFGVGGARGFQGGLRARAAQREGARDRERAHTAKSGGDPVEPRADFGVGGQRFDRERQRHVQRKVVELAPESDGCGAVPAFFPCARRRRAQSRHRVRADGETGDAALGHAAARAHDPILADQDDGTAYLRRVEQPAEYLDVDRHDRDAQEGAVRSGRTARDLNRPPIRKTAQNRHADMERLPFVRDRAKMRTVGDRNGRGRHRQIGVRDKPVRIDEAELQHILFGQPSFGDKGREIEIRTSKKAGVSDEPEALVDSVDEVFGHRRLQAHDVGDVGLDMRACFVPIERGGPIRRRCGQNRQGRRQQERHGREAATLGRKNRRGIHRSPEKSSETRAEVKPGR